MSLKKNDIHIIEIEDLTNLGFGVARINGSVVFVSDTVPGDVIECKIIKVGVGFSVGKAQQFITRSKLYSPSRCSNTACKSCAYKNVSYDNELLIKTENVRHEVKKAGLSDVEVLFTTPSPKCTEYRNKAQYPLMNTKDGIAIGFFAPKSHRVTEAAHCPLSPSVFTEILELLRKILERHNIAAYDESSGSGLMRHIYLRRGEISGEILLTLVINGDTLPYKAEFVTEITRTFPNIVGILLNKNTKKTNVILSDNYELLWGRDYIYDTLAGIKLKISAPSFYQVNHETAELIYKKARELAAIEPTDTVLDLYCGTGSIGLSLAKDAKEVIGIEIIEDAVRCANENASLNNIANAHFFTGDAADTERLLEHAEQELGRKLFPNVIVLDPPRAGCDEKLINYVARLNPQRIVYVSCNPATLARDIVRFKALGYSTNEIAPMDMFPLTGHVECVVCLTR